MVEPAAGRRRVAVVGGGAAGISAAFRLRRSGAQVTVFEADERVGGRCRTVTRAGFTLDVGAGAMPSTYTDVLALCDDLGIRDEIELRGAVIGTLRDGAVHRIARRNPLTFLSARHIPARDKASLWRLGRDLGRMFGSINYRDLGTAARFDTESLHDYCTRHYPDPVRDNLLEPITRALLLTEPEQTSVVDLFAACKSLLVAGHILGHPEGVGFFLDRAAPPPARGTRAAGGGVAAIAGGGRGRGAGAGGPRTDTFDAAVLALPAGPTLAVHPGLDPVARKYLENLTYSTAVVVSLGVGRAPAETSSMVLVPRDVEPDLCVVGLGHNLAPGRAPAGAGVLTAFWMSDWSERHLADPDDELVATTRATVDRLFPGWADDVRVSAVARWTPALVSSRVGTYAELVEFHAHLDPRSRIQLAGDYHAQTSVNASVAAGARAADRLAGVVPHPINA